MRGRGLVAMFVAALLAAAIGAGCGGSDSSSTVTVSADVDKATFLKKVEAVCKQTNVRTSEGWEDFVKSRGGDPEKAFEGEGAEDEFVTTVVLPQKQKQVEELGELTAPEKDQEQVEAIVAAYQEGVDVGEADPDAVMSAVGVFKYAAKTAEDYGLRECRW